MSQVWDRSEQALRVRVRGCREDLCGRPLLDDLSPVHHDNAVGEVGNDAHVVRDEDDRGAEPVPQVPQELEDRRLDGDVEGRGRLVGDDHLRLARDRNGDHDTLLLPAGQQVRVGVGASGRLGDPNQVEELDGASTGSPARQLAVRAQCLDDLPSHRPDRVERRRRLLADHGDPVAADPAHGLAPQPGELSPVEPGRSLDGRGPGQQAEQSTRAHGSAGT